MAVRRFVYPVGASLGACVSAWHIYIEIHPEAEVACDPENPCSIVWIREWGYVTIPVMALRPAFALHHAPCSLRATRRDDLDDADDELDEPDVPAPACPRSGAAAHRSVEP